MSRGMATVVTSGGIPVLIGRVVDITRQVLMFIRCIDMAVKCPCSPATEGTDDKPYQQNTLKSMFIIHNIAILRAGTG